MSAHKSTGSPAAQALACRRTSHPNAHAAVVDALAELVTMMLPLARAVASDAFTPDDRARLRQLAGKDAVFDLSNELYCLCGERARSTFVNNSRAKK